MKGSSTITASFPAGPGGLPNLEFEDEDSGDGDEGETQLMSTIHSQPTVIKTIPFGSTLASRSLRVRLIRGGMVKLALPSGEEVGIDRLPPWERKELMEHVYWAQEVGAL
jgi:hypothetical protein